MLREGPGCGGAGDDGSASGYTEGTTPGNNPGNTGMQLDGSSGCSSCNYVHGMPRLQALLQQRQRTVTAGRLTSRLEQLHNKVAKATPVPAKPE